MDSLRPLLTTYAYNILGSFQDAEDIVQDAFLRFMKLGAGKDKISDEKAYLVRMVINLSINLKKRKGKLIDNYPGEWLPEPVDTENAETIISRKEVLSYSLMVLMEKLNPKQRAVFILKEAFDYDHEEIAGALSISVENSRKLLSRAKEIVHRDPHAKINEPDPGYLQRYMGFLSSGDTEGLEKLLKEDITVVSDGGGKAVAFINPIHGRSSVLALLLGLQKKFYLQVQLEKGEINHQPAFFYYQEGKLVSCQIFDIQDGIIRDIFFIRNPDKLRVIEKKS
jgi:RNA polymerase sigma factor (sigma-70 family)